MRQRATAGTATMRKYVSRFGRLTALMLPDVVAADSIDRTRALGHGAVNAHGRAGAFTSWAFTQGRALPYLSGGLANRRERREPGHSQAVDRGPADGEAGAG